MIEITVDGVGTQPVMILNYISIAYPNAKPDTIINAHMNGNIYLNGRVVKNDVFVSDGDEISLNLFFFHLGLPPVLDILYEDENFIAIEKMPGVLSFDEYKAGDVNVYDMTLEYMLQKGEYSVESLTVPYLCYTLSEFSGGILLIAKHEEAYHYMTAALTQRKVLMTFEAAVVGHPEAEIDEMLDYMDVHCRIFSQPQEGAYPIVTRYKCINPLEKHTIVEISPLTYRRFQVNAHMAYIGCPVLGDTIFGNRRANRKAQMDYETLWLKRLRFSVGDTEPYFYLNHVELNMENISYPNNILTKGTQSKKDEIF